VSKAATETKRFNFSTTSSLLTLCPEFFSSFPHGSCLLLVSHCYILILALGDVYHPSRTPIPNGVGIKCAARILGCTLKQPDSENDLTTKYFSWNAQGKNMCISFFFKLIHHRLTGVSPSMLLHSSRLEWQRIEKKKNSYASPMKNTWERHRKEFPLHDPHLVYSVRSHSTYHTTPPPTYDLFWRSIHGEGC